MIINLTQHAASPEQIAEGVVDLTGDTRQALINALTVEDLPTRQEILDRAQAIAEIACYNGLGPDDGDDPMPTRAMIGGAPWLMAPLEAALRERGITPLYAFSRRESVDQPQPDGSVRKVAVFRHAGWIEA